MNKKGENTSNVIYAGETIQQPIPSILIEKNTKGYNYRIKLYGEDIRQIQKDIRRISKQMERHIRKLEGMKEG